MYLARCTSGSLKTKWRRKGYWILWKLTSSWWSWCERHGSNTSWWRCSRRKSERNLWRRRRRRRASILLSEMYVHILEKITNLNFIIHLISFSSFFQIMLSPGSRPRGRIRFSSFPTSSQGRYGYRFQRFLCGFVILHKRRRNMTGYVQWSRCRCRSCSTSWICRHEWKICVITCAFWKYRFFVFLWNGVSLSGLKKDEDEEQRFDSAEM